MSTSSSSTLVSVDALYSNTEFLDLLICIYKVIIKNLAKPRHVEKEVKYIISPSKGNHQPFALIATQYG